jgi:hypothetical protein
MADISISYSRLTALQWLKKIALQLDFVDSSLISIQKISRKLNLFFINRNHLFQYDGANANRRMGLNNNVTFKP